MTTIAWDGKTLAGDRMTSFGVSHLTTTKVLRIGDVLIGCAGNTGPIQEFQAWVQRGRNPGDAPTFQRDKQDFVQAILIEADGTAWLYFESPYPARIESPYFAIGSGSEFALAAMYLGCTAHRAVEVAAALDRSTGNGVDALSLIG